MTPSWWTDLWLNEGFATYMQYLAAEDAAPDLKFAEHFQADNVHASMKLDALASSHPVSLAIGHPDEIGANFDAISYRKGASIVRMLETVVGRDTFKAALKTYMGEFAYEAVEMNDLWEVVDRQARMDKTLEDGVTVKGVMDTWTLQEGFPVVTVKRDGTTATVSQVRIWDCLY